MYQLITQCGVQFAETVDQYTDSLNNVSIFAAGKIILYTNIKRMSFGTKDLVILCFITIWDCSILIACCISFQGLLTN